MLNVTLEQAAPGSRELHDVRNEELLPSQLDDENAIHKIVSDYYEATEPCPPEQPGAGRFPDDHLSFLILTNGEFRP